MQQCDTSTVSGYQIQKNTAERQLSDANGKLQACLAITAPAQLAEQRMAAARPEMERLGNEADTTQYLQTFILNQLRHEVSDSSANVIPLAQTVISEEVTRLQNEITRLRAEIRTEKRRFTDAGPTAQIPGIPFISQPDNKVLLAFLIVFGLFLVLTGLLIILNQVPVDYFMKMSMGERLSIVATFWVVSLLMMYVGFFNFT
jgi:uncharacterized small protein (DUF1192 family)